MVRHTLISSNKIVSASESIEKVSVASIPPKTKYGPLLNHRHAFISLS